MKKIYGYKLSNEEYEEYIMNTSIHEEDKKEAVRKILEKRGINPETRDIMNPDIVDISYANNNVVNSYRKDKNTVVYNEKICLGEEWDTGLILIYLLIIVPILIAIGSMIIVGLFITLPLSIWLILKAKKKKYQIVPTEKYEPME
jgi:hypothetical protein